MKKFKDIGIKLTPQRLAILDYLEGNVEHPSAEDIYNGLRGRFPTMSLATVYATLSTLREKGRVIEITIDPDKKRFDPNISEHSHLICTGCKRVVDIKMSFDLAAVEEAAPDFIITGAHAEFLGLCPGCSRSKQH